MKTMTQWLCDGCKARFDTKKEAEKHEETCVAFATGASLSEIQEKYNERLSENRLEEPHQALISDHLSSISENMYWVGLLAQITVFAIIVQMIVFGILILTF